MIKVLDRRTGNLLYGWLLLAISSLIFAGLFAFLIAMSRTPFIQDFIWLKEFFYKGLVGHVTLAFVIWFLSFMGVLWVLSAGLLTKQITERTSAFKLGWTGLFCSSLGTLCIIMTTLAGWGSPKLANYVPVLTHPLFYTGLILFAAGIFLLLMDILPGIWKGLRDVSADKGDSTMAFGMAIAGLTVLIALVCFGLAYHPLSASGVINFELLFWGGGHILQFTNTISMVAVWIFLLHFTLGIFPLREGLLRVLLWAYLLCVLPAPLYYFIYDISTPEYKNSFTRLMEYGIGPPTGILIVSIIIAILAHRIRKGELPWKDPMFSSLFLSVLVFSAGGIISLTLEGSNVKIPAHYHSVIGGVTLAFMGLTYYLLPLINREVYLKNVSKIQPYLYGVGVLIFSLGLYWAGSHGVPRKTFGPAQNLDTYSKLAGMALMGIGGIVAISGGATFVINAVMSLFMRRSPDKSEERVYAEELSFDI